MKTPSIYLNFAGNTEEAFNFYKSVFGGEFLGEIYRFKGTPDSDRFPEADQNKIMHVALMLKNGVMLMGTDTLESMGQKLVEGNNISIYIDTENKEEADTLFAKLSEDGKVEMPMADVFWGAYFGSCTDKFGIQWMVNFTTTAE